MWKRRVFKIITKANIITYYKTENKASGTRQRTPRRKNCCRVAAEVARPTAICDGCILLNLVSLYKWHVVLRHHLRHTCSVFVYKFTPFTVPHSHKHFQQRATVGNSQKTKTTLRTFRLRRAAYCEY